VLFGLTAVTGVPGIGESERGASCGFGVVSRAMSEDDLLGGVGGSESVSGMFS